MRGSGRGVTTSADWMSIKEAIAVTKTGRTTIVRWVSLKYVRRMKSGGRVLVRRSDVLATERALFDGQQPEVRG
ncbi:helix-turn-helix domain-containing protein [Cryobacterium aureum]|uniref:helix-turn-helix domain-containing protein n=1 Tax=Cryobacterium aureum TaxID=995037 RepID=UPI000CF4CD08|nr:helix-turn-helix domain-containing protein [Cryobacterium aureum]